MLPDNFASEPSAVLSECGQYRYLLTRPPEIPNPARPPAVFVMLNPSTADARLDDPTIRRCRGFARDWGCAGLVVCNLFSYRATNPNDLGACPDPVGPETERYLMWLAGLYPDVVVAWGANAPLDRVKAVSDCLQSSGARLWCLDVTKDGAPRHPLYVRKTAELLPWDDWQQTSDQTLE